MRAPVLLLCLASACVGQPPDDSATDGGAGADADPNAPDADPNAADAAPGSPDAAPGSPDAAPTACARVTGTGGSGLNLREGPGTQYAIIVTMPEGATVELTGATSDIWREVTWNAQTGWASGDFLTDLASCDGGGGGGYLFLLPWTAEVAYYVTQGHNTGSHTGNGSWAWDFGMPAGTPVLAAHNGTVRLTKGDSTTGCCSSACSGQGNYVVVDRGDGLESVYLHLQSVSVGVNQQVTRGDLLGYSGETGWACGAHLHFQIGISPSGGGSSGTYYNPSVHEYFHDTGSPVDYPEGSQPVSKNGTIDLPAPLPPESVVYVPSTFGHD